MSELIFVVLNMKELSKGMLLVMIGQVALSSWHVGSINSVPSQSSEQFASVYMPNVLLDVPKIVTSVFGWSGGKQSFYFCSLFQLTSSKNILHLESDTDMLMHTDRSQNTFMKINWPCYLMCIRAGNESEITKPRNHNEPGNGEIIN